MKIPELLLPVGAPEQLEIALRYGADAVYLGSEALSLRAKADNFDDPALQKAIELVHLAGKKLYLAVNIFAHETDLSGARALFEKLAGWPDRPDAFIISDPGLILLAGQLCPKVPLHLSTQANTTNSEALRFWMKQGVSRAVLARELSLTEIRQIRDHLPEEMELECFVHGAMCMSYSGRCLISSFLTGRDANRGLCTQPCRWEYALMEEKRPGQYFPIRETERGTYLYNAKDLCMISHLPELIRSGVCSLKVEGRMKNDLYLATVGRAYRLALDALAEDKAKYREILPWCEAEVLKCTTRELSTGFYLGRPDANAQSFDSSAYRQDYRYLGLVREDARGFYILQKNKFTVKSQIEAIRPDGSAIPFQAEAFETEAGEKRDDCPHPGQKVYLRTDAALQEFDILREKKL